MHFTHTVTIGRYETIGKLLNSVTFDAFEWPVTRISSVAQVC